MSIVSQVPLGRSSGCQRPALSLQKENCQPQAVGRQFKGKTKARGMRTSNMGRTVAMRIPPGNSQPGSTVSIFSATVAFVVPRAGITS